MKRLLRCLRILILVIGFCGLIHLNRQEGDPIAGAFIVSQPSDVIGQAPMPEVEGMEEFRATAYCLTGLTKYGVPVAPGHVAADPKVIPLGSMIYIETPFMRGVYQVMDTGEAIKGKIIDIFIPSYERCREFGRRAIKVKVLRYGFKEE